MTQAIENQVERFAPGFTDRILARHRMNTQDFSRYNPNYVGGAITGGVADVFQLFTRPVARLNPYATPNPRLLLCSASTPPGGGVHGMCGYHAAQSALKRIARLEPAPLLG
jgi:phytoene dehydrogenase-like protein